MWDERMSLNKSEPVVIDVREQETGWRLDRLLAERLEGPSRSRLKTLIKQGQVRRDTATIEDPSCKVKPGERYRVWVPPPVAATPEPQNLPLAIVHEDDEIIVIDKPAGLVVHPAAGNRDRTLVNALLFHCGNSLAGIGGVQRPGIVHRLDKDTSGLMVVAKTEPAHESLRTQFDTHSIERIYRAVIWGAPRPLVGTIDAAIMRHDSHRQKMTVARRADHPKARRAVTHYRVIARYGPSAEPVASLVDCRLETGRTHQIRVHFSHIGHPLIGDPLYGAGRRRLKTPSEKKAMNASAFAAAQATISGFPRQALHAYHLGFRHPASGESVRFSVDLPRDIKELINCLESL